MALQKISENHQQCLHSLSANGLFKVRNEVKLEKQLRKQNKIQKASGHPKLEVEDYVKRGVTKILLKKYEPANEKSTESKQKNHRDRTDKPK